MKQVLNSRLNIKKAESNSLEAKRPLSALKNKSQNPNLSKPYFQAFQKIPDPLAPDLRIGSIFPSDYKIDIRPESDQLHRKLKNLNKVIRKVQKLTASFK